LLAVGAFVAYVLLGGVLNPPPYEVVVAIKDIPPYTVIAKDMLAVDSEMMAGTVARQMVLKAELDQYLGGMAVEHIHPGEHLRKSAIVVQDNPAAARRLALLLDDPDEAVVVIPVSPETCPEAIAPDDYVDLLVSFGPGIQARGGQPVSEMLAIPTPPPPPTPTPTATPTAGPVVTEITPTLEATPALTEPALVFSPTVAITPTLPPLLEIQPEEMTLPITKITVQKCRVLAVRRARVANPGYGMGGAESAAAFLEGDIQAAVVLVPRESVELLTFAIDNGVIRLALLSVLAGQEEEQEPTMGVAWNDVLAFIVRERRKAMGLVPEPTAAPTSTPEGWLPPLETPTATPAPTETRSAEGAATPGAAGEGTPGPGPGGLLGSLACVVVPVILLAILGFLGFRIFRRGRAKR